jgi:hypothetical protein
VPELRNLSDLRDYDPLGERETMEGTDLSPIILTNVVTLGLTVAIGTLKLRYRT